MRIRYFLQGLMLSAVFFGLYITTQSRNQGHDSYDYALAVREGVSLFHPHHLLYNAIGHVVVATTGVDALFGLTTLSALCGAIVLGLVYYSLAAGSNQPFNSALWVSLLGVTNGFWYISTCAEVYAVALVPLVAGLALQSRSGPDRLWPLCLSALLVSVGVLLHQTGVFVALALSIVLMRRSLVRGLVWLFTCGFLVLATYVTVAASQGHYTVNEFLSWIFEYTHLAEARNGTWGALTSSTPSRALWGAVSGIVWPRPAVEWFTGDYTTINWRDIATAAIAAGALLSIVLGMRRDPDGSVRLVSGNPAFGSLVLLIGFAIWWEPNNLEFWTLAFPFLVICLSSVCTVERRWLLGGITLLASANFLWRALPDSVPGTQPSHALVRALSGADIQDGDLVLTFHTGILPILRYQNGVRAQVWSLGRTPVPHGNKMLAIETFVRSIDSMSRDHRVFVTESDIRPGPVEELYYPMWTPADYDLVWSRFSGRLHPVSGFGTAGRQRKIYELHSASQ